MIKEFLINKYLIIALGFIFMLNSCKGKAMNDKETKMNSEHKYVNQLINESSPYLLQHAHNPVDWYPWGEEALKKAKNENKMLIISIGYAACHWCHVMEKECFEDTVVANLMNKYFVSIKVDREERPDVDQVYMNAAQLITGGGGWPLNVFALPNGKPFYAGTYFPKDEWLKVLNYFVDIQQKDPTSLSEQAENVTQGIHSIENVHLIDRETSFSMRDLDTMFDFWKQNIDFKKGGGNRSPKFPMPSNWEYLLHYSYLSDNKDALRAVTTTLDNMAYGGIYDQIGGGFARYSTDADWHIPHFEKMLYDNAQLVSLYTHTWQQTKNPLYKEVVYETLEFIEREMTSSEGGFYSSLDADSDGEEGKFYVWTKAEIEKVLGARSELLSDYYNVTNSGNWEHGKSILLRKQSDEEFANKHSLSIEELHKFVADGKANLLKERSKRVRPGLDDKILTSWNALMLKGYAHAYRVFGDDIFLEVSLKSADFLLKNAISKNGITRNYKNGKSSIPGFLDDYAFTISAFIELYQATFDEKWLYKANELTEYTIEHFYDTNSGMFYYTHDDHSKLISRKMEVSDNVIPSSNSEMAKVLILLGTLLYNEEYIATAEQMLTNVLQDLHRNPFFYSNWSIVEAYFIGQPYEVAIVGENSDKIRKGMDQQYLPNVLLLGGENEGSLELLKSKLVKGQTTIYVCQDKVCKIPVTEVEKALELIKR